MYPYNLHVGPRGPASYAHVLRHVGTKVELVENSTEFLSICRFADDRRGEWNNRRIDIDVVRHVVTEELQHAFDIAPRPRGQRTLKDALRRVFYQQ